MIATETQILNFDIRGQICPSALLTALRELNRHRKALKTGTVCLQFLTDNRDATVTIPGAAQNMGYQVEVKKEDSHYLVIVSPNGL